MSVTTENKLLAVLDKLRDAGVHTSLRQDRAGAVSVDVAIPGQRWEVDVLEDGTVELEVFHSDGAILSETELDRRLAEQRGIERDAAAA